MPVEISGGGGGARTMVLTIVAQIWATVHELGVLKE